MKLTTKLGQVCTRAYGALLQWLSGALVGCHKIFDPNGAPLKISLVQISQEAIYMSKKRARKYYASLYSSNPFLCPSALGLVWQPGSDLPWVANPRREFNWPVVSPGVVPPSLFPSPSLFGSKTEGPRCA